MDSATTNNQAAGNLGACVQCAENCRREHRSQTAAEVLGYCTSAQRHPCFLKIALEHNLRSNMSIPKAFMDVHGKNLRGRTVDLEGANGKVWLVTVDTNASGVTGFRFGWQVFAADNNLKAGVSLLFTMVSENHFRVRVFNRTGLEFDVPGKSTNPINSSYTKRDSRSTRESQPKGVHLKLEDESDEIIGTASGTYSGTDKYYHSIHKGFRAMDSGEEHGGYGPSIQELLKSHSYQTGEPNSRRCNNGKARLPKPHRKVHPYNQQGEPLDPGWNYMVRESRRRLVRVGERLGAGTASEDLVTVRPSISVLMKPSHVYRGFWLGIPLEFSRQHMSSTRVHIVPQDTIGYRRPAKWVVSSHHSEVNGGWSVFSRDYQLEESDACVFEVLDSKDCVILVHIFSVGKVPLKPGKRGGWNVAYNVVVKRPRGDPPFSFPVTDHGHLPVLNKELTHGFAMKRDLSTDENILTSPRLAQALHKMVQNGQFSKRQRNVALSSNIRALTEKELLDEKEKPDIKSPELLTSGHFRRPVLHDSIYLSSDSVQSEPEDEYARTSTEPLPASVEAQTDQRFLVIVEDVSAKSPVGSTSPLAVYTRRHRKEGTSSTASKATASEKEVDERVVYPVVRLIQKRQRKNETEQDLSVELRGAVTDRGPSNYDVLAQGPE